MGDNDHDNTSFEPQWEEDGFDCAPDRDDLVIQALDAGRDPAELPPPSPAPAGAGKYIPCTGDLQWYQSSGKPGELAWLAEKFAVSFAATAGGLLRADLTVRLAAVGETTRRHFTQAIEEPTCAVGLVASSSGPADAPSASSGQALAACLEFSPALATDLVERLMGSPGDLSAPSTPSTSSGQAGPGQAPAGGSPAAGHRALTGAERRVLLHLANLVALSLSAARPGGKAGELRADLSPPEGSGDDRVVVATFELALGGRVGTMRLCGCGRLAGSAGAGQPRRAAAGPLEVTASIDSAELSAADLAELSAGDVIVTDLPVEGEVIVRIGGIPKFAARLRVEGGRRVLEITRRLGLPEDKTRRL